MNQSNLFHFNDFNEHKLDPVVVWGDTVQSKNEPLKSTSYLFYVKIHLLNLTEPDWWYSFQRVFCNIKCLQTKAPSSRKVAPKECAITNIMKRELNA